MEPRFFKSGTEMRRWLERNHGTARELVVGLHRRASGKPSLTWAESVDEALCFGWIDGIRRSLDESRYTIRFTPRRERSTWSAVNLRRVAELEALGRMQPNGRAAFAHRQEARTGIYAYEQRQQTLSQDFERRFRAHPAAWKFFQEQAAWYRRTASYWVMSAKRDETQGRRLQTLIEDSASGRRIGQLRRS